MRTTLESICRAPGSVRAHCQHHGYAVNKSDHVVQRDLRERIEEHGDAGCRMRGGSGQLFRGAHRRRAVQHRSNHRVLCSEKLLERFLFGGL